MKRVIFERGSEKEQQFIREVRSRVNAYFKNNKLDTKGDWRMYLKTIAGLSLYILPFVAILILPMPALVALGLAILAGVGEAAVGMGVMHDAAHGSYSEKRWVNSALSFTMFLLGTNTINWKIQHNIKHHTFTNIFRYDPDISTKAVIRLSEHAPLRKYHRFQHIYAFFLYGLMTLLKMFTDIFTLAEYNREGITGEQGANPSKEIFKLVVTKVIYFGILFGFPLLFTDFSFGQIVIGFAAMHITAGMIMSTVFQMAHVVEGTYQPLPDKANTIHSSWMVHEMRSTSDFGRRNGMLSWYIGGLDFQIEHHLFPYVCHIHYPAIAPIVEQTAREFDIYYNLKPTFIHALASHYKRLKELGHKWHPQIV